ncbi:MAG TPA: D-alanine--D-alanine ligase [Phycisphaerae bacterium]|nr:D-alanine--D-alanine ligase [Phycisphaerae bacterium]HPS53842.1 D-alanine--D-alanine ligase [Phycisphaerae bacterium]
MVSFEAQPVIEFYDITVLMGGISSEREVSINSGTAIADALEKVGHTVTRADISPQDTSALDREGMDLVFIALHGEFGESGEVQQLCEDRKLRYTGSGPHASAMGMDKAAAKMIIRQGGLRTADWAVIEEYDSQDAIDAKLAPLGKSLVVKPVDSGSSVDVHLCKGRAGLRESLASVVDIYGRALVETFIEGREFSVSLLIDRALPVMEIKSTHEMFDYEAKYVDNTTTFTFEHDLPEKVQAEMRCMALSMFNLLGCRDFSRVDFMVDRENKPYILEINTIPGFTSHSQLPSAARRIGMEMTGLVDLVVREAMKRDICNCCVASEN